MSRALTDIDEETLRWMYHERKFSMREIARRLGVSHPTIFAAMVRYKIRRRTPSDAMALFHSREVKRGV